MQVKLDAFRALVYQKSAVVSVEGSRKGFCLIVSNCMLGTDAGNVRYFQNLTTLARFAKGENVSSLSLDLSKMPSKTKKRAAKVAAAGAPKKRAARKAAAVA